jgi:hypothetical protein
LVRLRIPTDHALHQLLQVVRYARQLPRPGTKCCWRLHQPRRIRNHSVKPGRWAATDPLHRQLHDGQQRKHRAALPLERSAQQGAALAERELGIPMIEVS